MCFEAVLSVLMAVVDFISFVITLKTILEDLILKVIVVV